jgi:hypothetical protein
MSNLELITIIVFCLVAPIIITWLIASSASGVAEREYIEYEEENHNHE